MVYMLVCYRFVGKYLKVMNRLNGGSDKERKLVQEFTNSYLRQDGVFVLRFVLNKASNNYIPDLCQLPHLTI